MERAQKSQLANILLLVSFLALLSMAPFISSSSMRSSYLYFLLNLLIVVLGVEAGFLSAISKPRDERSKALASVVAYPIIGAQQGITIATAGATSSTDIMRPEAKPIMIMEKPVTAARVGASAGAERVKSTLKRCKSRPSLFFIGSLEPDCGARKEEEVMAVEKTVEEVGELSKHELFMKAEMFIGNFYKQLKMQRENSWQKLQDLYHNAF